jgi:hypothetical protein
VSGFANFERTFARGLERFPRLRKHIKEIYKRSIYTIYREKGFQYELHPRVDLVTPESWAGLKESEGELFFGYYDKTPWSSDMKLAVFHRWHSHSMAVMVIDHMSQRRHFVGQTQAWNWQQGAMAQWVFFKGKNNLIIFNDLANGILGGRIVNILGQMNRFIPWPVQTLHPGGQEALTINYKRLQRLRPDYGYRAQVKNFSPNQPLDQDGIWRIDLNNGSGMLIVTLAELAARRPVPEMEGAEHKVNHLIYSPAGNKFLFLHRYLGSRGKFSRLYVARADGTELRLLMEARMVSHYHWRDEDHILVWGRTVESGDRYYLVDVNTGEREIVGPGVLDRYGDGHCSFSRDGRWILTDTYPDRARQQRLLLFDIQSSNMITVGRFFSPWNYTGIFRCDLHPRFSPDGKWISIDSAHEGRRRTYFIDLRGLSGEI